MLLWLKFIRVHANRAHSPELREEFNIYAAANLKLNPSSQLKRVVNFTNNILFDEYNVILQETAVRTDFAECTFFANV